jgi:hypothetical protein
MESRVKTKLADGDVKNPYSLVKPGWSLWIEGGVWYTSEEVDQNKFGPHDYNVEGEFEKGLRKCKCGCSMYSSSSNGPVDPFGPCPENKKIGRVTMEPKPGEWWWVELEENIPGRITMRRVVKLTEKCVRLAVNDFEVDKGQCDTWYRRSAVTFVERVVPGDSDII